MHLQNLDSPADIVAAVISEPQASTQPAAQPAAQQLPAQNTAAAGGTSAISPAPGNPNPAARPATYHELKAALPGADATFLASQLEANATAQQAQSAYMAKLAADNQQLRTQVEQQAVQPQPTQVRKPGVAPVSNLPAGVAGGGSAATSDDPVAAWEEQLATHIKAGLPRARAVSKIVSEQPELHAAFIAAKNTSKHQQRQLAQRFGSDA
jgi:hypothetical protein